MPPWLGRTKFDNPPDGRSHRRVANGSFGPSTNERPKPFDAWAPVARVRLQPDRERGRTLRSAAKPLRGAGERPRSRAFLVRPRRLTRENRASGKADTGDCREPP